MGQDRLGFKTDNRTNFYIYTVDAATTANRQLTGQLASKTTVGLQFYRNVFHRNGATGPRRCRCWRNSPKGLA